MTVPTLVPGLDPDFPLDIADVSRRVLKYAKLFPGGIASDRYTCGEVSCNDWDLTMLVRLKISLPWSVHRSGSCR